MGTKKTTAVMAAVLAVAILGAGLAGADDAVIIRPPNVKFMLSTYGTYIEFSDNATADRITVKAENVVFENIKLENGIHTTSSLTVSVENADMTIKVLESEGIEFDLVASFGTKSLAKTTDGGRGKPKRVKSNGVILPEKSTLADLLAADEGWFYGADIVYTKTAHTSVNTISIEWGDIVPPPHPLLFLIPVFCVLGLILIPIRWISKRGVDTKSLIAIVACLIIGLAMLPIIISLVGG